MSGLDSLLTSVNSRTMESGSEVIERFAKNSRRIVSWIGFLQCNHNQDAFGLVHGFRNAIVEAAGYAALGLTSGALGSQRRAIELLHYWLFFAPQPELWRTVRSSGSGFPSRDSAIKYLGTLIPSFGRRWEQLAKNRRRRLENPYAALSQHLHAQSPRAREARSDLMMLAGSSQELAEICSMQEEIDEYLSDVMVARFMDEWPLIPALIRSDVSSRLPRGTLAKLVSP